MHHALHEPLAPITHDHQDVENRIPMDSCNPLNAPNTATFDQEADDLLNFFVGLVGAVQFLGALTVALEALATAEALITSAVSSKLLAFDFAIVAGHLGLPFPRSKPIMRLSVGIVGYSAIADLSPRSR